MRDLRYVLLWLILLLANQIMGINVSGHLTQDTVWSPDNNPYVVDQFLYVDAGVTLTIMPGVSVRVEDGPSNDSSSYFVWHGAQEPHAKMIVVWGKIIAIGTESQPITFDNVSGNPLYRWGGIAILSQNEDSVYRYCEFQHQYRCQWSPGSYSGAALSFHNGRVDVRHCTFHDVNCGISAGDLMLPALIYDCQFSDDHPLAYYYEPSAYSLSVLASNPLGYVDATIAKSTFSDDIRVSASETGNHVNYTKLFNRYLQLYPINMEPGRPVYGTSSSYGEYCYDCRVTGCYAPEPADTAYCRKNTVINTHNNNYEEDSTVIIGRGLGTVYLAENYGYGFVKMFIEYPQNVTTGYIYNNRLNSLAWGILSQEYGDWDIPERYNIYMFNNVLKGISTDAVAIGSSNESGWITNNTFFAMAYFLHSNNSSYSITNNIAWGIENLSPSDGLLSMFPTLSYNCLSFDLNLEYMDGGDNIYMYPFFADLENNDFHLTAGSQCIDAGIVTADLPTFDADYNLRVAGNAPDMGAYEYGSVYIGGIQGYVYDAQTLQPLDCAQIKISGKLPEFSDSLGCFPYQTGAGTYTITVKRFDYADVVIPNVVVSVDDTTWLNIPMQNTVANDEQIIPVNNSKVSLYNYPNPFRYSTEINFILPAKSVATLAVYNLKGQKVTTIADSPLAKGHHSYAWDIRDDEGNFCSSGIYLVKLLLDGKLASTRKVTLVK